MGIQSTRTIERELAINRIIEIAGYIKNQEYKLLDENSCEDCGSNCLESFIDNFNKDLCKKIEENSSKFSDGMLENYMDMRFFRFSQFENYSIDSGQ